MSKLEKIFVLAWFAVLAAALLFLAAGTLVSPGIQYTVGFRTHILVIILILCFVPVFIVLVHDVVAREYLSERQKTR